MMNLKAIFSKPNDSIPFGFIVFLTIIGYFLNQINGIIQYESSIPTIEYSFSDEKINSKKDITRVKIECNITNISKSKALKNLSFTIAYPSKYFENIFIQEPNVIPFAPNPINSGHYTDNIEEDLNIYNIPIIHPQSSYILECEATFNNQKVLCPNLYLDRTNESVRLMEKSCYTFILKKQLTFNIIILCIIISVTSLVFYRYSKKVL